MTSIQDRYAPQNRCFGCGPANEQGLRIKSVVEDDRLLCTWTPQPHHEAFPGVLNGGICGALLDCHGNWAAAYHFMVAQGLEIPPCTVTAEFSVKLKRPTPTGGPLHLAAWVEDSRDDRAVVEATLTADGKITATMSGLFVAVGEGHPAFHRW